MKIFKPVSVITALFLILLPVNVAAGQKDTSADAKLNTKKVGIVGEILEKRGKFEKHFLKEDGTIEAYVYPKAVHFKNNEGQWKDIDDTLMLKRDEKGNEVFKNKSNEYTIEFSKNADAGKLFRIRENSFEISWSMEGMRPSIAYQQKVKMESIKSIPDDLKKVSIPNQGSVVFYPKVFTDTDCQYSLYTGAVSGNIILNRNVENKVFSVDLKIKGLKPGLNDDNTISFLNKDKIDQEVFRIDQPFMSDAKGKKTVCVIADFKTDSSGCRFSMVLDKDWLNDRSRAYPVVINTGLNTFSDIQTAAVSSNGEDNTGISVGANQRSFMSFHMPEISAADILLSSNLNLVGNYKSSTVLEVHKVRDLWYRGDIGWDRQPEFDTDSEGHILAGVSNKTGQALCQWDITGLAKEWYDNRSFNSVMIKSGGTYNGRISFVDPTKSTILIPQISLHYSNASGIESDWKFETQNAKKAGMGYVNTANGNMTFVHEDLSVEREQLPLEIKHVYLSTEKAVDAGYGTGWQLNYCRRIVQYQGNSKYVDGSVYVYLDEDRTKHYFFPSGVKDKYKEVSGAGMTLEFQRGKYWLMKTKDGKKLYFQPTDGWELFEMRDAKGLYIAFFYTEVNRKKLLTSVSDGKTGRATLNYVGGRLNSIEGPSGSIKYEYEGNRLSRIVYSDNSYSRYSYDANGILNKVTNFDATTIDYVYRDTVPYRIQQASVKNENMSFEKGFTFNYDVQRTSVSDSQGEEKIYQYDMFGHVISETDRGNGAIVLPIAHGTEAGRATDSGLDLAAPAGTVCYAASSGRIIYSEYGHTKWKTPPDTPNSILIELDTPITYAGRTARYIWYTHMSKLVFNVHQRDGQNIRVKAGDVLGESGLGNSSPHLHFGIIINTNQASPADYFSSDQVREVLKLKQGQGFEV